MLTVVLLFIIIFFLKIIYEKITLDRARKNIKLIVHVNGIRGKSTVSRLIDAGLRDGKKKIFTKVTGTSPKYIDIDGVEKELIRKGKANIREQIKVIKWVSKLKIDILILECMAVKPEYQKICEERILKSNVGVITNVRLDHLDEMGKTLKEIAKSLGNTIPKNGVLFTGAKDFKDIFNKIGVTKGTGIIITESGNEKYSEIDFPENVEIALKVCEYLGVKKEIALERMREYKRDIGVLKEIKIKNRLGKNISFINALAANDPDSSEKILNLFMKRENWKKNKRYLMINNRKDRISRLEQFLKFTEKFQENFDGVIVSGENRNIFIKKLREILVNSEKIFEIEDIEFIDKLKEDSIVIAVGNICGIGKKIIDELELRGQNE